MDFSQISPRIIYIAGYGRSGSTLLDVLFGNHPAMFGAGELSALFSEMTSGGCCSCGQEFSKCIFWSRVLDDLSSTWPGITPKAAEQITHKLQAPGFQKLDRTGNEEHLTNYKKLWGTVFTSIQEVSGKRIIVDSSKNSLPSLRRIDALSRVCGYDVQVIHLVRDPRATMWSVLRGKDPKVDMGHQQRSRTGGAYRALVGWGISNLSVHYTAVANKQLKVIRLRYEDLVTRPVQELRRLGEFLNLDFEAVIDSVVDQHPFEPGHGVKGNRMRRRGPVVLKLDEEWKTSLPAYARVLAQFSLPLAARYGYNVLR